MRTTLIPVALIALGFGITGCVSGAALPSTTQAIEQPVTPPSPGAVETYAPDAGSATFHGSWAFDVFDVQEVILDADTVLIGKVISIDALATFEFVKGAPPKTRVNVDAQRVLKGDFPRNGDLYVPGGTVTLQQVFESEPLESSEKNGIAELDEEERRTTTVDYVSDGPVALEVGREYVFMLRHPEEPDIYAVAADGYGVFESSGGGFENRLTGEVLTIEKLSEMAESEAEPRTR